MLLAGSAPYVLYRDRLGVALAERRDGQWALQRLQRSGDVGYGLALVARGLSFHAAHSDAENRAVLYANGCLLYTSPSPRDGLLSRMPSSA